MKKLVVSLALSTTLATGSALAGPGVNQQDMDLIFNQPVVASHSQNLHKVSSVKAEYLSQKEMDETEGEWWPVVFAAAGGMASTYGYLANTSNPTWSGGLRAAGYGALGGLGGGIGSSVNVAGKVYSAYSSTGFYMGAGAASSAFGSGVAGISQWW